MFGKLKEKLKNWTQNLTKKAEETQEEIEVEESLKEAEEKQAKAKEEQIEKVEKIKEKTEKELDKKSITISESKEKAIISKKEKKSKKEDVLAKLEEVKEKDNIDLTKPKAIEEQIILEKPKEEVKSEEISSKPEETQTKPEEKLNKSFFGKLFGKKKEEKPKEEIQETPIQEQPETEDQGFFSKLKSKITKVKISENDFSEYAEDLQMILVENNVAYEVAEKIIKKLKQEIIGKEFLKKEIEGQIRETLKDVVIEVLIEPFDLIDKITDKKEKPYVILFCGINGTGKTTTIAKLASSIKKKGLSCILAGADTFRAASIEQIKKHGEALDIKVIAHDYGSDPASVGFDAVSYAKKNKIDVVLIDTAGRMHTEKNLMKEIEKISNVCKPDLKIFIGESTTGNDSIEQAKAFNFAIGIDAIILTKADTDEKGGTALSVGYIIKKPILYLGTGQGYDSLEFFNKNKFIEALGL